MLVLTEIASVQSIIVASTDMSLNLLYVCTLSDVMLMDICARAVSAITPKLQTSVSAFLAFPYKLKALIL